MPHCRPLVCKMFAVPALQPPADARQASSPFVRKILTSSRFSSMMPVSGLGEALGGYHNARFKDEPSPLLLART